MTPFHTLAAMTLALAASLAPAQGLPDPTRPPAGFDASASAPAAGTATVSARSLQSIIRRQGARSAAVISGVYVEIGGKVGDATLERVGEDSVDLRSAAGRETLYLTPGVGKQFAPVETGAARRSRVKTEKANRP